MRKTLIVLAGVVVLLAACRPVAPPPPYDPGPDWHQSAETVTRHIDPFLVCVRSHESSVNKPDAIDPQWGPMYDQGYQARNGRSGAAGAYQFLQSTWDSQARAIGRFDLVGRAPDTVWIIDQDLVAWTIRASGGNAWRGDPC